MTPATTPSEIGNSVFAARPDGPGQSWHAREYVRAYYWWYWTVPTGGCHALARHG
jgi:hypothetical protein